MSYFVLVDLVINDAERFREYQVSVRPMIEAAGGKYLVRGGALTTYEGDLPVHRLTLLQWPSKEVHDAFFNSEAYRELKDLRIATTTSCIIGVEGYESA